MKSCFIVWRQFLCSLVLRVNNRSSFPTLQNLYSHQNQTWLLQVMLGSWILIPPEGVWFLYRKGRGGRDLCTFHKVINFLVDSPLYLAASFFYGMLFFRPWTETGALRNERGGDDLTLAFRTSHRGSAESHFWWLRRGRYYTPETTALYFCIGNTTLPYITTGNTYIFLSFLLATSVTCTNNVTEICVFFF